MQSRPGKEPAVDPLNSDIAGLLHAVDGDEQQYIAISAKLPKNGKSKNEQPNIDEIIREHAAKSPYNNHKNVNNKESKSGINSSAKA